MTANTTVTMTPVSPTGLTALTFALWGDAAYNPAASGGSSGGLQIVDRPRLPAVVQWYDRTPFELVLPLALDSTVTYGAPGQSIEQLCITLESWLDAVPGTTQPPVLAVSGPIPGIQRQWMTYSLAFTTAIRDPQAGYRTQQKVEVHLYEYISPNIAVLNFPTPATVAAQALVAQSASQSYALYTVNTGDTLSSIAAAQLGNYALWTVLASINNIRDPNSLTPGQIISIPQQS